MIRNMLVALAELGERLLGGSTERERNRRDARYYELRARTETFDQTRHALLESAARYERYVDAGLV